MARSLNKVTLIGNLTRDPELRYTPSGTAVCSFGLATNRSWSTEGEKKEDVEFHRIVAWQKLAELCAQLLGKGRKVYVEGRLQTRRWTGQDEIERQTTEIVINEMIILDSKYSSSDDGGSDYNVPEEDFPVDFDEEEEGKGKKQKAKSAVKASTKKSANKTKTSKKKTKSKKDEDDDDIPF
ncbi:single-stranded DNA-binding protein [Candidatus Woesebacteria bacterium]|nr:single-stranded DNA-binding protein [Candidatus Woesebacteria bacterium]